MKYLLFLFIPLTAYSLETEVGIKFDSGYGDGAYSVYGYVNKHGAIVKVEIKMGDTE